MLGNLANQLQIWGFESDFVVFADGSLGFGLEAKPLDVSCRDSDFVNGLAERSSQFLNGLPANIDIQFVQEISSGNEAVIKKHGEKGIGASNEVVRNLTGQRVKRLLDLDSQGVVPKHGLKIFVRRSLAKPLLKKSKLFSKKTDFISISEAELAREISATLRIRDDIIQNLDSLGVSSRVLSAKELLDEIYRQWNPTRRMDQEGYDSEDIRSSVLFTDASVYEKGFSLRDMHYRVVSLKLLPEQSFASMAQLLRDLPFDSKLFLTINVPDQQKEISQLQTQRRLAFSMARGKRTGVSDIESEAKLQDLEALLEQMIAQGEKIFHVSFNVLLRSTDEDDLESQVMQTLTKIREMSGAEGMEESLAAFDIFSEFSIPNARAKERSKRLKTSNLADFLPIYGPWSGHDEPSILLRSRSGSLVKFDPFSKDLPNHNQLVSGGSGSGKSFFTNILLMQLLKENPKIFIVDIGGSYRKICGQLSGQYIPLGVNSGLSMNPFDLAPGESVPSSDKIKFLVSLVEIMTKEEGAERLPRLERAEIEEAIQKTYETSDQPRLSVLRQILLDHEDVSIRRFGRILTPWCGNTPFGHIIDQPTTLTLQKTIVSFDLKGLDSFPDLQAVCLFIITDFVWREVQGDVSTKKILVFDECWKLLENEAGAVFIGEVFRTFRKYYAGAIAISQNMDDFAKSKVAGAVMSNSAVKWILMQRGADQQRLKEVLQLNDNEMDLIASLHQQKGFFSEAFLIAQDQKSVVAIESSPLEYWLATTDPRDLSCIEKITSENPEKSQFEILTQLAEKYPRGMVS